jgi:hypothetical protein
MEKKGDKIKRLLLKPFQEQPFGGILQVPNRFTEPEAMKL